MSPELDLLDQLCGDDVILHIAWQMFDASKGNASFARAQHAIEMQAQAGEIEVVFKDDGKERLLENWEVRKVMADKNNWLLTGTDAKYYLRLTDKGAKRVS